MRSRRFLTGRQLTGVVASVVLINLSLGLLGGGAVFLFGGVSFYRECRAAAKALPLNLPIDVSQRGITRGTMHQTASFSCKQSYTLEPSNAGDAVASLEGLQLTFKLLDSTGKEPAAGTYPTISPVYTDVPGLMLGLHSPVPEGTYQVEVEVVEPATSAPTAPLCLRSRYGLCGIEWMGAWWAIGIGVIALVVGTPFGIGAVTVSTATIRSIRSTRGRASSAKSSPE